MSDEGHIVPTSRASGKTEDQHDDRGLQDDCQRAGFSRRQRHVIFPADVLAI